MISVRGPAGDEVVELEEFEARVREGRIAPSTPVNFPVLTGDRWVDARELEFFRRLYAPARLEFTRAFSLGSFPWFTAALCLFLAAIYLYVGGLQRSIPLDPLIDAGAKWQPNVLELGETWRLVTANFLHRDILHLFFNSFFLFNVGGTIENAYRFGDYVAILVISGIVATITSTVFSDLPSVGASGMILGLFGSASVFGYKYGEILPRRYRRYFGGAVLPYALFILYMGLVNRDTDNWGHLGGMLGGILVTLPLEPKLLHLGKRASALSRHAPWVLVSVVLGGVLLAGPLVRAVGPAPTTIEDRESGIAFTFPAAWTGGTNHLGHVAWGNALGASIGVQAETEETPIRLRQLKDRFMNRDLSAREVEGEVTNVKVLGERPWVVPGGGQGLELDVALDTRTGPLWTRNLLATRGRTSYVVSLAVRRPWSEAYTPIMRQVAASVRLVDPKALVRAQRRVEVFGGMSSARVALGEQLAAVGRVNEARAAFATALDALPGHASASLGRARLILDYGGDLETAESTIAALYDRHPADGEVALVLSELRQRLGQVREACLVVQDTVDRLDTPPPALLTRLRSLDCRSTSARGR